MDVARPAMLTCGCKVTRPCRILAALEDPKTFSPRRRRCLSIIHRFLIPVTGDGYGVPGSGRDFGVLRPKT